MAYRFLLSEDFQTGARRIAAEQVSRLRRSLAAKGGAPEQIHEARKAIKRLRALLRLLRPGLAKRTFAKENAALRRISRRLSAPRNLDAIEDTIGKLEAHFGISPDGLTARLRQRLAKRRFDNQSNSRAPAIERAQQSLSDVESRLADIRLQPSATRMIGKGLALSYSLGRRRLKKAYASGLDEDFHDLRKAVQQHWRHMQLMTNAWPEALSVRVAAAREVSHILGEDHDIAELASFMIKERRALPGEDRVALTGLCAARQHQLRGLVFPKLKRLYAEPAPEIRDRIRLYWRLARQMSYMDHPRQSGPAVDTQVIELKT